jgi:hypothetical protein
MSISAIPSSIFSPYQPTSTATSVQKEFQQLGQALESGNLSSAQSEFASLQQSFSQSIPSATSPSTSATFTPTGASPLAQSFTQLGSDLKNGNLAAAQKDYSGIQQEFRSHGGPIQNRWHNHPRIHFGGNGSDPTVGIDQPANPTSLSEDLNQIVPSITSGNPGVAQQAYATLQQELQQFALGGNLAAQFGNLSAQSPVSLEA